MEENTTTTEQISSVANQTADTTQNQPENTTTDQVAETQTQTPETAKEEPPKPFEIPIAEQPKSVSFDNPEDLLKVYKGDPKALLQHLGLDEYMLQANDYYKATGNLAEYAEVKSVDWNKVSDERLIETMLREQYSKSNLSEDKIQKLVQHQMRQKYLIGDDNDPESEEVQLARIQMELDAGDYRQKRIERQNQFRAPERTTDQEVPTMSAEQVMEQQRNDLLQDQNVQQFLSDKKVSFGDYNHAIDNPQETLATIYDQNRWMYHLSQKTPDGKVLMKEGQPLLDRAKMLKVAAYVQDMEKIEQGLIAQGRTIGKKEVVDEAENIRDNSSHGTTGGQDSFWLEFAKTARVV